MIKRRFCNQIARVGVLVPLLTACVTLGKLKYLSIAHLNYKIGIIMVSLLCISSAERNA